MTIQRRAFLTMQRATHPMTVSELAQSLAVPYDSAKVAVNALHAKDLAIPASSRRRGQVWMVARDKAPPIDLRGQAEESIKALARGRRRRFVTDW
jgi:hypothetical protein